jgi:hypothetical protein
MDIAKYMEKANEWKRHTSSKEFAAAFTHIMEEFKHDNALRSSKVEEYLIEQALNIGVVKQRTKRIAVNPNRWEKHLAPWYNDKCREAKRKYKASKRKHGKNHRDTQAAYQEYKSSCKEARAHLQFTLPDILKQRP